MAPHCPPVGMPILCRIVDIELSLPVAHQYRLPFFNHMIKVRPRDDFSMASVERQPIMFLPHQPEDRKKMQSDSPFVSSKPMKA